MTQQQQSNTSPQDRQLPMQSLRKGSSSEPCNHVELFEVYEQLHSASDSVASAQVMFFWLSNLVWLHWVHPQILRQMPQTETPTTILFCFPTPQMAPNIQQYSNITAEEIALLNQAERFVENLNAQTSQAT